MKHPHSNLTVVLAGCVLLVAWHLETGPVDAAQPNILIILVDDMGYGDPGCYNADSKISTPHIDSLAHSGMRFTDAHAPGPLCHMSRYGLMTGRYPFRVNVQQWRRQPLIEKGQTTIASLLRAQGYRTAMVGKWHLGFAEDGYDQPLPGGPVDVGFDSFFGIRASTDIPPYFYIRDDHAVTPPTETIAANSSEGWSPIQGAFWRAGEIAPDLELQDVLPRFTDEAIAVMTEHAAAQSGSDPQQPMLLYLAFPAPHTPWLPAPEFVHKSQAGMYGDFVTMVDAMIGRVLTALDQVGMSQNTLVVLTSDNGPVWYEADVQRFGHDSSGGLRGMKADAWEAGHRMPFIIRWPGQVVPGSVSHRTICFTDLLATLAAITGYSLSAEEGPDSFDFSRELFGTQPAKTPIRPSLVMRSGGGFMTVRQGDWKLIEGLGSGGFSPPKRIKPAPGEPAGQLYNLKQDSGETANRYRERPEIAERLRQTLTAVQQSGHTQAPVRDARREVYKTVGEVELALHVWEPEGHQSTDQRAAALFFFGGGWSSGTVAQFAPHCRYLASRGMIGIVADYRVSKRHQTTPFECVKDAKSAVRWVRTSARRLGIDPNRIAVGGGSAGGHMAAATATIEQLNEEGEDTAISARPDALLLFNPVYDNGPGGYGYQRFQQRYAEISPLHNIRGGMPPAVVFLGTNDRLIPVETAKLFQQKMKDAGSRSELFLYQGQPHGFFNHGDFKPNASSTYFDRTMWETDRFLASLGFLTGEPTIKLRPF